MDWPLTGKYNPPLFLPDSHLCRLGKPGRAASVVGRRLQGRWGERWKIRKLFCFQIWVVGHHFWPWYISKRKLLFLNKSELRKGGGPWAEKPMRRNSLLCLVYPSSLFLFCSWSLFAFWPIGYKILVSHSSSLLLLHEKPRLSFS